MPLDAICLMAVREELDAQLANMRIDRVRQPEKDLIILSLHGAGGSRRLIISAGSGDGRIHLTEHQFDNPKTPPTFCMLLRKHIVGARIDSVTQPPSERIITLSLNAPDAMGVYSRKYLIIEMLGRLSNIILTDENNIIIDCLRRIGGELTQKRFVLPGLQYHPPPKQEGKLDPLETTQSQWDEAFKSSADASADKWLLSTFSALSPLICRELSWRAYGSADFDMSAIRDDGAGLKAEFFALMEKAKSKEFEPWMLTDENNAPKEFSYTQIGQYENIRNLIKENSFSELLDGYFTRTAQMERIRQRASATSKTMTTAKERLIRKLVIQHEELKNTELRDALRESGDIITANIHNMEKGQSELIADDFYSESGGVRTIRLDPQKTPAQNAARYYKEYTKAKNAVDYLSEQIKIGQNELVYIDSVLEEISLATSEQNLLDIREELTHTGYIKVQKSSKRQRSAESKPMRFESSTGMQILVGRNNIQNDQLTLKAALKSDIWLHAQKTHGAHVIISAKDGMPDEVTLNEAAAIAAYYSSARSGGKTPIDYAYARHVKKPSGGRPGMVIYTDYKTIMATADEGLVQRLRKS